MGDAERDELEDEQSDAIDEIEAIQTRYQRIDITREAAYNAFNRSFERENPLPVRPTQAVRRDWLMRIVLALVVIGGMVVSGSRTVVVFSAGKTIIVGGAAFVMLEAGAVSMAFYYTRYKYLNREIDSRYIARYLFFGSILPVIVMCSGNVQDVFTEDGFAAGNLWVVLKFGIAISISLAAPIMVFIVGHVLAMLNVQDAAQDRKATLEFEALVQAWHDRKARSWQSQQSRYGASVNIRVEPVKPPELVRPAESAAILNDVNLVNLRKFTTERPSHKLKKALDYLKERPELWASPSRDLVDKMGGLSHMTINKAQRILKSEEVGNE